MSKGGFKAFRGESATASDYLLQGGKGAPGRLDEYLGEGHDREVQYIVSSDSGEHLEESTLTHPQFRAWMEHADPVTGEQRGMSRHTRVDIDKEGRTVVGGTPLYQETLISASKSLSLAAAQNPEIDAALVAAQERAVVAGVEALAQHAVTRVGRRGAQRQVRVERLEATSVQHKTSRGDDPHFHRHVEILPKVFAEGKWRTFDGRTLYRLAERVHAAADLAVSTDSQLRRAIADAGLTWQPGEGGGQVKEFEPLVDKFSSRRDQIRTNVEELEAQWRGEHPDEEPGPAEYRTWDQIGWDQQRPAKNRRQIDAGVLTAPEQLRDPIPAVEPTNHTRTVRSQQPAELDPGIIARDALADLSTSRSAWSSAAVSAAIDRRIADSYLVGSEGIDGLRTAAMEAARPELVNLLEEGVVVEGASHWTSRAVQDTDAAISESLHRRTRTGGVDGAVEVNRGRFQLSEGQAAAARAIAGSHRLVVVEGAAGSGKTTMLSAANESLQRQGRHIVAVSPTKRGAEEMGKEIGAQGDSVHGLLVRAGARFNDQGHWTVPREWRPQPAGFEMDRDAVLVVDEAGMLDAETARVLHAYADDVGVGQITLMGDARQLSAVGRGGYLARAAELSTEHFDLRDVQRFRTPDGGVDHTYANASLKLRERQDPESFFTLLEQRGAVRTGTADEALGRVAETVALEQEARQSSVAVVATNATAQQVNWAVYERLAADGVIDTSRVAEGREGDPIAAGARVATRRNDSELGVANRQTWQVTNVLDDGRVTVQDPNTGTHRTLDADYVGHNVQLAWATTAHGAQGMTVDSAHTVLSDQLDAAGAYVGLTRGRHSNTVHAVAADIEDARGQFMAAMGRERADVGLTEATRRAAEERSGLDTAPAPAVFRSRLHDVDTSRMSERARAQVEGVAALEDAMGGRAPSTPAERAKFEELVRAGGGASQGLLNRCGDEMAPETLQVLQARVEWRSARRDVAGQAQRDHDAALQFPAGSQMRGRFSQQVVTANERGQRLDEGVTRGDYADPSIHLDEVAPRRESVADRMRRQASGHERSESLGR